MFGWTIILRVLTNVFTVMHGVKYDFYVKRAIDTGAEFVL